MPAPDVVQQLVERFAGHEEGYTATTYNETEARLEFIDPLFSALGWDVGNTQGVPPDLRDVIYEQTFRRNAAIQQPEEIIGKRPDYTFRIEQRPRFYVEAKKPAEDVKNNPKYAYQVRSYGWSTKLPISVLTDFQELSIYDCRVQPKKDDGADVARIPNLLFRYDQYVERWDELTGLLSRDEVLSGSLDSFAETPAPRGATTVDAAFLKDISDWRHTLAEDINRRNPALPQHALNYAVQMIINRIIFLRIAEDRGIEPYERLKLSLQRPSEVTYREGYAYRELVKLFTRADELYNSGLFHFRKDERDSAESRDTLTPNLQVGDDVLAQITTQLYYPYPYRFDAIPIEILGQVYEQFLGKVIVQADGGGVTVEDKPEVRKAGGVYYTPTYIVDYIVEHTVGKLLEGKSAEDALKLRVLDPACGSGSFLIGAYDYLLKWYLLYYTGHDPETLAKKRVNRPVEKTPAGDGWRLTLSERKRILLANIYGVDIDTQAVEVTKLSLLLKVLERESEQQQLVLGVTEHERILPDLANNIKCGNSLIGPDFYRDRQASFMSDEEERRINVFDWEGEGGFPAIMQAGGFDAVIGNPPYARIQTLQETQPETVPYVKTQYMAAKAGNFDIYVLFLEKGYSLLREKGVLGYILPHKFFQAQFGQPIRDLLTSDRSIDEIVHFGAEQVFPDASVYTCLLFLVRAPQTNLRYISVKGLDTASALFPAIHNRLPHSNYTEAVLPQPGPGGPWSFSVDGADVVLAKLQKQPYTLGDITRKIFVGLQTSADRVFALKVIRTIGQTVLCSSASTGTQIEIETALLRPFLLGRDIHRYDTPRAEAVVIFPYLLENSAAVLMSEDYISSNFPLGWQYLLANKEALASREKGRFRETWWQYGRTQNLTEFEVSKVMTPDICSGPQMTIDVAGDLYHTTTIYSFVFLPSMNESSRYFLGVLNSALMWFFLRATGTVLRGGYMRFKTEYLKPFPIRTINFDNAAERKMHDDMVQLVETMLALHKQLHTALTPNDKSRIERRIEATDRQIDELVYRLYGLTAEEIAIVERVDG